MGPSSSCFRVANPFPTLMHRIPSELRIKRAWARVVLGWHRGESGDYGYDTRYGLKHLFALKLAGAIIPALMHRIPSELRRCDHTSSNAPDPIRTPQSDHTSTNAPDPIRTPQLIHRGESGDYGYDTRYGLKHLFALKLAGAIIPALMHRIPSELRRCDHTSTNAPDPIRTPQHRGESGDYGYDTRYGLKHLFALKLAGAIIPALMHRIPSELRRCDHTSSNAPDPIRTPQLIHRGESGDYGYDTRYGLKHLFALKLAGAIIPALMHRIPSELRRCDHTSSNAPDPIRTPQSDHTSTNAPDPIRTPQLIHRGESGDYGYDTRYGLKHLFALKLAGAIIPALMHRIPSELRRSDHTSTNAPDPIRTPHTNAPDPIRTPQHRGESGDYGYDTRYGLKHLFALKLAGAIIPALMHRIPSELRSTNAPDPIRTPQLSVLGRE
ncbi:hypothetical protein RIF29_46066 [Crotalaria pallida]|uniref:Uncharacterized protein n=1 Tax=Crotalaria pallida TaxID=3830 RepID=A0AAN9DZ90_CROPI